MIRSLSGGQSYPAQTSTSSSMSLQIGLSGTRNEAKLPVANNGQCENSAAIVRRSGIAAFASPGALEAALRATNLFKATHIYQTTRAGHGRSRY